MSYCLNPKCPNPSDPANAERSVCRHCGSGLLLESRYRLVQPLGGGGFGKTYEIDDRGQRKVLKVLLKDHPKAVALFKQEADVLARLRHPGIPKVERDGYFIYSPADSAEEFHCLVMEKIAGANLQDWLKSRGKPITQEQAVEWLKQLAEILDQVHRLQYFHRDIKPQNIMCKPNGQLVLIDFGTAREVSATYFAKVGQGQNVTGIVSPGYSPPEQTNGKAVPQSDFFAMGRTFVYLLTGKPPTAFPENPRTGKLMWRKGAPHVSDAVASVIDYLMAPFPGNRPQNPQMILQCLADIDLTGDAGPSTTQLPGGSQNKGKGNTNSPVTARSNSGTKLKAPTKITPTKIKRNPPKLKNALLIGAALLLLALGGSQVYSSVRYGFFASPAWLLSSFPSSQFLEKSFTDVGIVNAIALSPDGQILASGSFGTIRIWNLKTGKLLRTINGVHSKKWVKTLAIAPDNRTLVSGGDDNNISIWNLRTGKVIRTMSGHKGGVNAIAISRDGQVIASGSDDKTVCLWNLKTGSRMRTLSGHNAQINALVFSRDGQTLVSGSEDKTLRLWNFTTGKLKTILKGHAGAVKALAISPDGQTLASGSSDNTIRIWNLKEGKSMKTLDGHSSWVRTLAISPDGKILVSGGGKVIVWNLRRGREKIILQGHNMFVNAIAISPDGKSIITGSPDETIKIWKMP
ncbi:serine/threonine protein kinase [Oscillatoriales cyanobacterium USR001]|nr:serine/threonine protein kinase [Oscillatoriales cyanobacterium USR001]